MVRWKPASSVFQGGTAQVLALKGQRVRTRVALLQLPVNVVDGMPPEAMDLAAGKVGLLANPRGEEILIAFPRAPGTPLTTLDALSRSGAFTVVRVNWPTFRAQFEVEASSA